MSTTPPHPSPAEAAHGAGRIQPVRATLIVLRSLGTALVTPAASGEQSAARASGPPGRGRRLAYVLTLALAAVLVPVTAQTLSGDYGLPGALTTALGFAQAGPLLLAVTRPLPAWWIVITADTVGALLMLTRTGTAIAWPWPPTVIIGYLALCLALALREGRRTLIAVWTVTAVLSLGLGFLWADRSDGTNVLLIVFSGIILLLGATVRERADAQLRLAEQETISEAERSRRTLLEERARIARELHDVVAHHMSVITVQADSARYRLSGLPPGAQEEFGSIAATARESLAEMRRLLGVLRSEENHGERAPQPGLDRLGQLVEATVRAGVPTELSVAPGMSGTPQAVQLSAYRIVQEALANVVRHAPGATGRVSVSGHGTGDDGTDGTDGTDGDLTVLVVNGPPAQRTGPPVETPGTGTGHGLVGMRERVRLVGGTLETGPLPDGGFRVAARLPLFPATPDGKDAFPS